MKWIKPASTEGADTQNGITYLRSVVDGETRLLVKKGDSSALVKGWSNGELGITLGAGAPLAPASTILTGTATGNYLNNPDTGSRKVEGQADKDMIWGAIAADQLYGGDGDDIISAPSAEYLSISIPRSGVIPGITEDIIWTDVSQHWTAGYNVQQMNPDGSLDFQAGGDVAINTIFWGASALGDGWIYQFSVSGGVFQLKYYHPTLALNGEVPATSLSHEIYSGYAFAGGVCLSGDAGNDLLVGNSGDDLKGSSNLNDNKLDGWMWKEAA